MKKLFLLASLCFIKVFCFSQRPSDPVNYLVNNDDFINWISSVTNNQWEIQVDFSKQLGEKFKEFQNVLRSTKTSEDVDKTILEYGLDPEFSDQKIAEHIASGLPLIQNNPWLWEDWERGGIDIIRQAYFRGMASNDSRWMSVVNGLLSQIQGHCGTTNRISASEIASCFWDTITSAFQILGDITAIVTAVNGGNLTAAIAAIKKVLKSMSRKFGWFGLAIAAIDIGVCIWNANGDQ